MTFTKKQLVKMKEKALQSEILIPLFRAMQFRDVQLYHGGPLEQGKDIVMWRPESLRERVNYGVVVKAGNVSGKITGKSTAGEVLTQVQQCFDNSYSDIVSSQERHVDRCLVVCSGEVRKEAYNAIAATLRKSNLDKLTDFINGERLWSLVEEFMPEAAVFEHLETVRKQLDSLDPHYSLVPDADGGLIIRGKYPDVEKEHPITVSGRFVFPDTPEGKTVREQVVRLFKTGDPLTITQPYLDDFKISGINLPLADFSNLRNAQLIIASRPSEQTLNVNFEVLNDDGTRTVLEHVELRKMQEGTEEATFSNKGQHTPWEVQTTLNKHDNKGQYTFKFSYSGFNVKQQLDAVRVQEALSKGGTLRAVHIETGLEIANTMVVPSAMPAPNAALIEHLEDLVFIQGKASVLLSLPNRDLAIAELNRVSEIAEKIRTGKATLESTGDWPLTPNVESAKELLRSFGDGRVSALRLRFQETADVFGVDVPLGQVEMICDQVYFSEEHLDALRALVENPNDNAEIEVSIKFVEGSSIFATYPSWLPSEPKQNAATTP